MSNAIEQAVVVTSQTELNPSQSATRLALFDEDGDPFEFSGEGGGSSYTDSDARAAVATKSQIAALSAVTAPDATLAVGDAPTDEEFDALVTLANANKAALNSIIAALKA